MTAHTAAASSVHEPVGRPGGPGLWHHKGLQLPPYIQHVANELRGQGHGESEAVEMAVGIVKNWAAGHDGHGHKVHPDVQAAAARNIAQWEALKAKATGRSSVTVTQRAEMTSASINDLPDSAFAYIEPGGKVVDGKTEPRSKRHFPVHDAAHVRNALARAPQSPFGDKAMPKIKAAARKFAVDVSDDDSSGRAESVAPFYRDFPLRDLSVRSGGRDGRIVTAYAAVFDTPTEIHDQDGDYYEVIDPSAFNRAISDARPQGSRKNWRIGVFYNHGRTLAGTPSDRHSMPIGVPVDIRADGVGVLTETQYHRSDFCEEIVEGLESGAIPGYSFSGMFRRSQPLIPRGGFRKNHRTGELPSVRRTESTLREYGPTPFPAYADAAIVGMRAETILAAMAADPELAQRMVSMFRGGAPLDSPPSSGAPAPGLAAEDSPPRRSGRPIREELLANRSAFLQRHRRDG